MSNIRLTPALAYKLGYARALRRARGELRDLAAKFDAEVRSLQREYSEVVGELRREKASEICELQKQLVAAANEADCDRINRAVRVLRAIDAATHERSLIPDELLH